MNAAKDRLKASQELQKIDSELEHVNYGINAFQVKQTALRKRRDELIVAAGQRATGRGGA